jgi:hypothetical protein
VDKVGLAFGVGWEVRLGSGYGRVSMDKGNLELG